MSESGKVKSKGSNKAAGTKKINSEIGKDELFEIAGKLKNQFFWMQKGDEVIYSANIEKITGYAADEIKSLPGRGMALIYEEDLSRVKKEHSDFTNDNILDNIVLVYRIRCKNDKIIWVKEDIFVDRKKNGTIDSYYGVVSNILELKEEENKLKEVVEQLQELNASKDQFISILSHDLRAPFTSILGFSEILLNEPELSSGERSEYVNYIYDSSQTQLQLINYLLDWSRLQTGRIKVEKQRLQAQSLVYNSVSSLTGNAIRKDIEIKVDIADSLYILADERLINQVISNLISNAIKFSNEGGKIEISADIFNDELLELIFKDEGIGISEENKPKLFSFDRMYSTEGTKGEKGTGLGLSLVKQIVEKHGGNIWFYSEPGEGSEFHFTVPISKNTILIVDENIEDRKVCEEIINDYYQAFQVVTAESGYEAISSIINKKPVLLITGHKMPLMSGLQLAETIRKDKNNIDVPIIVFVDKISEEIKKNYEAHDVHLILQRPVDPKLFHRKLQNLIG